MYMTVFYLWLGILIALALGHIYLLFQMRKHSATGNGAFGKGLSWWSRRYAFMTDATAFTNAGQVYRRHAIRLEALLVVWMLMVFVLIIIHDAINIAAMTGAKSLQ